MNFVSCCSVGEEVACSRSLNTSLHQVSQDSGAGEAAASVPLLGHIGKVDSW